MNWRVVALVFMPCVAPADELYRWVDAQGNVHLSETPPPGSGAEEWKPKPLETAPAIPSRTQKAAPTPSRAGSAKSASTGTPASKDSEDSKIGGRTEAEWRREALEKQQAVSTLEDRIREVEEMPEFRSSSFKKNAYGEKVATGGNSKQGMLISLRGELTRAQSNLEHFEDYARQAGVPAGWLR